MRTIVGDWNDELPDWNGQYYGRSSVTTKKPLDAKANHSNVTVECATKT
jgi:hypothetical protein